MRKSHQYGLRTIPSLITAIINPQSICSLPSVTFDLEQFLAYSRCSLNLCKIKAWMIEVNKYVLKYLGYSHCASFCIQSPCPQEFYPPFFQHLVCATTQKETEKKLKRCPINHMQNSLRLHKEEANLDFSFTISFPCSPSLVPFLFLLIPGCWPQSPVKALRPVVSLKFALRVTSHIFCVTLVEDLHTSLIH